MAQKRKNWDAKSLREAIKKWKKFLETPTNKDEIKFEATKPIEKQKYISPKLPVPTKASFNQYVSKNTIKTWGGGNETQRKLYGIYQDEVVDHIEHCLTQRTMESGKGAAGAMFLLKSTFGYTEYGNKEDEAPIIINIDTKNSGNNKI